MPLYRKDVAMFRNVDEARRFYASPSVVWFIPTIVALTAGILVGALIGLVAWRMGMSPLFSFLITAVVVSLIVWGFVTSWIFGKIELGPRKTATIRIEWEENEGRTLKFLELDTATLEQFFEVCRMVVDGGTLSIGNLQPYFRNRESVQAFQRELITKNLAMWNNIDEPKQGMSLTSKGQAIFNGVFRLPTDEVNGV